MLGRRFAGEASATAALCVGGGSSTAGFQTITLNICKQIKKQNHPVQVETSAFLSLSACLPFRPPLGFQRGRGRVGMAPWVPRLHLLQPQTCPGRSDGAGSPAQLGTPRHLRTTFSSPGSCPEPATKHHHTQEASLSGCSRPS